MGRPRRSDRRGRWHHRADGPQRLEVRLRRVRRRDRRDRRPQSDLCPPRAHVTEADPLPVPGSGVHRSALALLPHRDVGRDEPGLSRRGAEPAPDRPDGVGPRRSTARLPSYGSVQPENLVLGAVKVSEDGEDRSSGWSRPAGERPTAFSTCRCGNVASRSISSRSRSARSASRVTRTWPFARRTSWSGRRWVTVTPEPSRPGGGPRRTPHERKAPTALCNLGRSPTGTGKHSPEHWGPSPEATTGESLTVMPRTTPPLRILTWHVHGSYLDLLIHTGHEFFLPVRDEGRERQAGSGAGDGPPTASMRLEDEIRISTSTSSCSSTPGTGARTTAHPLRSAAPRPAHLRRARPAVGGPHRGAPSGRRSGCPARPRHCLQPADVGQRSDLDPRHRAWGGRRRCALERAGGPRPHRDQRLRHAVDGSGATSTSARALEFPSTLSACGPPSTADWASAPHRPARLLRPLSILLPSRSLHEPRDGRVRGMMIGWRGRGAGDDEMPTVLEDGRSGIVHTDPDYLIDGAAELIATTPSRPGSARPGRTRASASRSSGSAPTGTAPSGSRRSVRRSRRRAMGIVAVTAWVGSRRSASTPLLAGLGGVDAGGQNVHVAQSRGIRRRRRRVDVTPVATTRAFQMRWNADRASG